MATASRSMAHNDPEEAKRSSLVRPKSGSYVFDDPDYSRISLGTGAADGRIRQLQGECWCKRSNRLSTDVAL